MTPQEIWDEIFAALSFDDLARIRIRRDQTPAEWIKALTDVVAVHLDECDDPCERDHCPEDCSPNCSNPTGDPNGKA